VLTRHAPALADNSDRPETSRPVRAVPAPAGPAQRHVKRAAVVQAASTGLIGVGTGNLDMASTAAVTTSPKALRTACEAFAATLGRQLADRDVALPLRPAVLRRLDTVDAVLVDPRVLCGADLQVARVRGVSDGELSTAWTRAHELLDQPDLSSGWHPVPGMAAKPGRRVGVEALILSAHHRLASAVVTEARGSGVQLATVDLDVLGELRPAFDDIRPVPKGHRGAIE
jgi:hypothetical protein